MVKTLMEVNGICCEDGEGLSEGDCGRGGEGQLEYGCGDYETRIGEGAGGGEGEDGAEGGEGTGGREERVGGGRLGGLGCIIRR